MDAERRDDLKHNEFGDMLIKVKETLDRWATPVLVVVAVIVVGVVGVRLWRWQKALELERGWSTLSSLNRTTGEERESNPDALRSLAEKNIDPRLSAAARLRAASVLREKFMESGDEKLLDEIDAELKAVVDADGVTDQIKAGALYQQAILRESKHDFDGAKAIYQQLSQDPRYNGSPFKDLAATNISEIPDISTPVNFLPGNAPSASAPASSQAAGEMEDEPTATAPASAPAGDRTPPAPKENKPASQPASTPSHG